MRPGTASLLAGWAVMGIAYGQSSIPVAALRGASSTELTEAQILIAAAAEPAGRDAADKAGAWYIIDGGDGQHPENVKDVGGALQLTVKPYEEAVRITSTKAFKGGKLEVLVKSAAIMPGVITSIYLASGNGRTSDANLGKQDEIDLEWKGNDPTRVQTNVFINGEEDLLLVPVGGDSSKSEKSYGVEWDSKHVTFLVDGAPVRTKPLVRALAPMKLQLAVWTTAGGWPGLIQWAGGPPDWDHLATSASATFNVVSFPQ